MKLRSVSVLLQDVEEELALQLAVLGKIRAVNPILHAIQSVPVVATKTQNETVDFKFKLPQATIDHKFDKFEILGAEGAGAQVLSDLRINRPNQLAKLLHLFLFLNDVIIDRSSENCRKH